MKAQVKAVYRSCVRDTLDLRGARGLSFPFREALTASDSPATAGNGRRSALNLKGKR